LVEIGQMVSNGYRSHKMLTKIMLPMLNLLLTTASMNYFLNIITKHNNEPIPLTNHTFVKSETSTS